MCCVSTRGLSEQLADFRGVSKRISFIGNNNGPSACAHRAANYNPIYLLQKLVLRCANPLCRHALGSLASAFKALQKQDMFHFYCLCCILSLASLLVSSVLALSLPRTVIIPEFG